jgi:hypothetical protein
MPIKRRPQARRTLKRAKQDGTPQETINEAMVCMVNKGVNSQRLQRRLQRWGFSEQEANTMITTFYPQNPS